MADTVTRSLVAPVSLESVEAVYDLLASWWDELGDVEPRTRFAFETAVVEIAGNIVEHSVAAEGVAGRHFTLDLHGDAGRLRATFQDDAQPAELDLSAVTMADEDSENGRGLALALASVDTLDYRYENGRNIWSLECRRE
ncbi:ATP-binding protein [Microbacterium sp. cf332]|uniref:ATP-binding protein n=1 Tax=Microbacterium sp. cf332 TaxID=1761804 RepID=UPI00088BAFCE|nr:ATP-binding protein [Microbacterium sp. cf332]SDQ13374.1 serine/threonine-protein kinase RsbW [Microbacterium sp. cf332]